MKKLILPLLAFFIMFSSTYAASVEKIDPINNTSININLSENVDLSDGEALGSDIKILEDLLVSSAYKDMDDNKKVVLELTYDLKKGDAYNVLAISGAEGNADFVVNTIPSEIPVEDAYINQVNVIDSKNLELVYKNDLDGEEFIYKVLKELGTKSVFVKDGILTVTLNSPLEEFSSYILLINSLFDVSGEKIPFEEIIYDFITPDYLENTLEGSDLDEVVIDELKDNSDQEENEGNIEKVAMNSAKKTPDTGTATGILVLFAAILGGFYFVKSKKQK